jgi:hypothetical protein
MNGKVMPPTRSIGHRSSAPSVVFPGKQKDGKKFVQSGKRSLLNTCRSPATFDINTPLTNMCKLMLIEGDHSVQRAQPSMGSVSRDHHQNTSNAIS